MPRSETSQGKGSGVLQRPAEAFSVGYTGPVICHMSEAHTEAGVKPSFGAADSVTWSAKVTGLGPGTLDGTGVPVLLGVGYHRSTAVKVKQVLCQVPGLLP